MHDSLDKMVFGGFLAKAGKISLYNAENRKITINKNHLDQVGLFFIGIPHIGLRIRARVIIDQYSIGIKRFLKANKENHKKLRILDAGCGPGLYSIFFGQKGHKVIGVDLDNKKIETARKISEALGINTEFLTASILRLPFENESFDIVICSDVIEHIKEDKKALLELNRVLKGKGILILTTTGNNRFTKQYQKKFGHERPGYNKRDFREVIKGTDLKLIKTIPCLSLFGKLAWLLNRRLSKSHILSAILFYTLYFLSLLDYWFNFDMDPINITFVAQKK